MKKFMELLVAVLIVLGMASVACTGIDFTLEFVRDFDAELTSSEMEIVTGVVSEAGALDCTLTWMRDWAPGSDDTMELDVGVTFFDTLRLGFDRELTVVDPGAFTATLELVPITLEYVRGFEAGLRGSLIVTFERSI